jgi:hypothetical protein
MGRSASPFAFDTRGIQLSPANAQYLEGVTRAIGRNFTLAFNEEVDFARTLNLPASELRALHQEAARRGITPWQYIRGVIKSYAMGLPHRHPLKRSHLRRLGEQRTTINIRPVLTEWLEELAATERVSFLAAVNLALDFSRDFLLSSDLRSAVDAQAEAQGDSRRGVVLLHIWHVAWELMGEGRKSQRG